MLWLSLSLMSEKSTLRLQCFGSSKVLIVVGSLNFLAAAVVPNCKSDLFTQEPARTGRRLASRCLRLDFPHTTWRWVWLLLPRRLISSVSMWNNTHCLNFWHIITPPHNLPFITFQSPPEVPAVWPQRFRSSWFRSPWQKRQAFFHFSHAVMGNKTPLVPRGNILVRRWDGIETVLLPNSLFFLLLHSLIASERK